MKKASEENWDKILNIKTSVYDYSQEDYQNYGSSDRNFL